MLFSGQAYKFKAKNPNVTQRSVKVYEELIRSIITGRLKLGEVIKEDELALMFGVSRTPVREALARLEKEGLITRRGKSYVVTPLSADDVVMLYEARIPLEATAARLAAIRASESLISEMGEVIGKIKEETSKQDPSPLTLAELNGRFHELVARGSGNRYIEDILRSIRLKLKLVRVTLFTSYQRRVEEAREHEEVYQAIRARNPEEAYRLMLNHENEVMKYVKERVLPMLFG